MARADIKIVKNPGPVIKYRTDDRTTSSATATIKPGDVVKKGGAEGNFATIVLTGDPEVGTDMVLGVVASESTETSTADGTVDVYFPLSGQVIRGKAATAANIDTDAELLLLLNDSVAFDRSAATEDGTLTIDEDEGDDPNVHGLTIIDGDTSAGTLDCLWHILATVNGTTI